MRCPQCNNRVLHKAGTVTRLRLHGPVEFDEKGVARGRCHWCKTSIELPIQLSEGAEIDRPEVFLLQPNR